MKNKLLFALLLAAALPLAACSKEPSGTEPASGTEEPKLEGTVITLSDSGIDVKGGGARASSGVAAISASGTYTVTGAISNGQILIDTGDDAMDVVLILNNADITNPAGPAIYIRQAKQVRLQTAAGSVNRVVSGTEADAAAVNDQSSGAAIYAEDDLDIEGEGSLEVLGYINNGISCKDDLDVNSGTLSVTAANNGLRGSESVDIKGGTITVAAGNDGVKSTSADKEGKGAVTVSGGSLTITAGGDGISAETELTVEDGEVNVVTTGDPDARSSKALKAQTNLTLSGGMVTLSATDHAVHSGAGLTVSGGVLNANSTGGKAVAAHGAIAVTGGELALRSLGDGIETPAGILVSGGTLSVVAGDDGLQAGEANSGLGDVTVSGGALSLSAKGQSVNARGTFTLTGGSLLALGGSDKRPAPAEGGQKYLVVDWSGPSECTVTLSAEGLELTAESGWAYKKVLISDPALTEGMKLKLSNGFEEIDAKA